MCLITIHRNYYIPGNVIRSEYTIENKIGPDLKTITV